MSLEYINYHYRLSLAEGDPVLDLKGGRRGYIHGTDGSYILIQWEGADLPSGPYHPLDDQLDFPLENEKRSKRRKKLDIIEQEDPPTMLTDQEVERQGVAWQKRTGRRKASRLIFEEGMKWARDNRLLSPYPFKESEVYTGTLVNALRLGKDGMSQLLRDLIDRGAYLPTEGGRFISEAQVKEMLREIIWHNCDIEESLRKRGIQGGL